MLMGHDDDHILLPHLIIQIFFRLMACFLVVVVVVDLEDKVPHRKRERRPHTPDMFLVFFFIFLVSLPP
jgi:hypothetical protein